MAVKGKYLALISRTFRLITKFLTLLFDDCSRLLYLYFEMEKSTGISNLSIHLVYHADFVGIGFMVTSQ